MSETITIGGLPQALEAEAGDLLELSKTYVIDCPEARVAASEDLKRVKTLSVTLEEERKAITKPLDEAKSRVMDLFRRPLTWLQQAEATLKRACLTYDAEVERVARLAAAEAEKAAAEARRQIEDEAKARASAGDEAGAHALHQAAEMVSAAAPPVPAAPKLAGESTRTLWKAEVTDLMLLCRAIGEGKASTELVTPNMPALNGLARSLKGSLAVPGVRAISERVMGASRVA